MHIDTINPVLPRSGDVEITGTVTNVSDETFTRINLHAFSSQSPILDSANLVNSAASDPDAVRRRAGDGAGHLLHGRRARARARRRTSPTPCRSSCSGWTRARRASTGSASTPSATAPSRATPSPTAGPAPSSPRGRAGTAAQEASVILSIRSRVWFTDDGTVGGLERWARGSRRAAASTACSTWPTPPAVDAVQLAGRPGRARRADAARAGQPGAQHRARTRTSPTRSPPTETPAPERRARSRRRPRGLGHPRRRRPRRPTEPTAQEQALATASAAWLDRFRALVGTQPVLTLPFGDLDVSAAVRNDRTRLDQAVARSAEVMAVLRPPVATGGVAGQRPPQPRGHSRPSRPDTWSCSATAPSTSRRPRPNSVVRMLGHKVRRHQHRGRVGRPRSDGGQRPAGAAPAAAQRGGAARCSTATRRRWSSPCPRSGAARTPRRSSTELEQPWLDVVPVEEVADDRAAVGLPASSLDYTDDGPARPSSVPATSPPPPGPPTPPHLLEQVLTSRPPSRHQVRDEALVTLSEQHRDRPRPRARRGRAASSEAILDELGKIQIEAPPAVTLSSDSGKLGATLVNGLDQPVTVQVRADDRRAADPQRRRRRRELGPARAQRAALRGHHRPARHAQRPARRHLGRRRAARLRPTSCRSARPGSARSSGWRWPSARSCCSG